MRSLLKTDAMPGLQSPVDGGHRSGLKPDAEAEQGQETYTILKMLCQAR
jgi:hypothetical protein